MSLVIIRQNHISIHIRKVAFALDNAIVLKVNYLFSNTKFYVSDIHLHSKHNSVLSQDASIWGHFGIIITKHHS